ncbi:BTB/POZ domain-containing protein 6-B-like [Paramacrobiotus metropolitanus]|uniref:BTB/POZ domain-containing protein 6-B-like n=1 Tax=Paramacrobiotus metropolitanus TaxID=2943436 RepID=UPI002445EAFC|nr:BTB/POZ domain-containing protein 6-B-like [Paramacrobiotus metropolitanus]
MSENFSKVPLSLASSMQRSLISGEYSDVRFTVGRHLGPVKCFPVHKYVLCLRSPVFGAMFYGKLPEKCDKAIDIPDVVPDAFANMLSFLYTDTVKNLRVDNVIPTLMCADKYDLPQLQKLCCDFVSAQLSADNCLVMLENAVHFHVDAIMERCLECIDRFADDVLQLDYFAVLDQKIIVLMLQRNTLIADENNVYLAAERWAVEACKANNMDPSAANRRQMLGRRCFSCGSRC